MSGTFVYKSLIEGSPKEINVFSLILGLEEKRKVIGQFEGIFHGYLPSVTSVFFLTPNAGDGGLDFFLHPLD